MNNLIKRRTIKKRDSLKRAKLYATPKKSKRLEGGYSLNYRNGKTQDLR
jgi:hypothetical protein